MLVNRRIWIGVALASAGGMSLAAAGVEGGEGGEGGEAGAAAVSGREPGVGFPGGTFETALRMVLAGEGGEGGIGLDKRGDTVSIPALTGEQVSAALSGNTLRLEEHFAYYFDPAGTAEGWETRWSEVEVSKCGDGADRAYLLEEGECWYGVTRQLPAAKWTVRDRQLCTEPAIPPVTGKDGCATVFMILNNVALFEGDRMVGKGNTLHRGKQLQGALGTPLSAPAS